MTCPVRLYPYRKPDNHRVPIPRWTLSLPQNTSEVYTTYIGVQQHSDSDAAVKASTQAVRAIGEWIAKDDGPSAFETFKLLDDATVHSSAIWVCYWSENAKRSSSLESLSLPTLYSSLSACGRASVGIWQESFATEVSRLETNYSGLDYLPGLARLPGASTVEHTLSAYWGAARDRIPDSSHDLFTRPDHPGHLDERLTGFGQFLVGTNPKNLVHIRSGQYWKDCGQQEADSYEQKLEPSLRAGLRYLRDQSRDVGAIGIRYLRNESLPAENMCEEQKETCGAGFFANLEDLENWAKTHRSHLKIYRGALSHYKAFGDARKFRTWHEVSIIRQGDARFEYLNCNPTTGVVRRVPLNSYALNVPTPSP